MKSSADYSYLNTGPRGASSFAKLLYSRGEIVPVLTTYDSIGLGQESGVLVVIGPNVPFTPAEVGELRAFLEGGGVVILAADDFRIIRDLFTELGIESSISRAQIISPVCLGNSTRPLAVWVAPELAAGVDFVVTERPRAVFGGTPILMTSNASLLGNSFGSYAVGAVFEYGEGRLYLFSDPDIFSNALFPYNRRFIENFLESLPEKRFMADEAHHADFNPYSTGTYLVRRVVRREYILHYVLFVGLLYVFIESGAWVVILEKVLALIFRILDKFFGEEDGKDIIRILAEKGLDEDVLRRIVREIETGSRLKSELGGKGWMVRSSSSISRLR
ncbi:DUF4350 domain-containing protein [Pyrococcus yayanosii]|nr:DUF4350 domain-containing protein [Pyrococcus yayanosii]